jgi:phage terminase large subunit-like protein
MKFDKTRAQYAIDFIQHLKLTDDFHGQNFTLIPWQKQIISDVYGSLNARGVRQYRYAYIECAKKNAKSALTSAVANLHLFNPNESNGQIYICAGDKEQAEKTIYNPLVEMIEQDESLIKRVKILDSRKEIENKKTGTFLKVVSAEAYTKHGLNISCCIFDELHAQPNRDLYDVMMKGAGLARRQPIWWFITTAGDDPDRVSIAWEVHEKAESILKARKEKDKEHDIDTWYPVIYSYNGEDIFNEKNWKKANPSLGTTLQIEDLRDLAKEAKLHPADEKLFRWLNLCQWVTIKLTSWLPLDLFDSTVGDWSRNELLGAECYIGGDFSTTTDLSGTCLLFPPQSWETTETINGKEKKITHYIDGWRMIWDCWIPAENMQERIKTDKIPYDKWVAQGWIIPTPGNVVSHLKIKERFGEYKKMYKVRELPFDLSFATTLVELIQSEYELTVVDVPQTYAVMTDPINFFEELLKSGRLTHEPNPVARWCFGNASIVKNGNAQKKFVKEHKGKSLDRTKRIDLMIAAVNAIVRGRYYPIEKENEKLPVGWGM